MRWGSLPKRRSISCRPPAIHSSTARSRHRALDPTRAQRDSVGQRTIQSGGYRRRQGAVLEADRRDRRRAEFLHVFTTALTAPATAARTLIQNLAHASAAGGELGDRRRRARCPRPAAADFQGLDFYGLLPSPIHTFEYLQSVARGFAQEAIQAEREFMNFKTREDWKQRRGATSRLRKPWPRPKSRRASSSTSRPRTISPRRNARSSLRSKRRADAIAQRAAYASASASTNLGAGRRGRAERRRGCVLTAKSASWPTSSRAERPFPGPGPKLAAAQILRAGRKTREYRARKNAEHN